MKIKEFAIIGINKGNGHPYSFSAIVNGYDKKELNKFCEFDVIKKYLIGKEFPNKKFNKFKIKYIFTSNINISKKIAKSCKIKYSIQNLNELPKNISGIILARDDFKYNEQVIKFCAKKKISLFVDKQISKNKNFLINNKLKLLNFGSLYGGSGMSFCDDFLKFKKEYKKKKFKILKIICTTKGKWINYGQHLLDPIYDIVQFDDINFVSKVLKTNTRILKCKISNVDCEFRFKENNYKTIKIEFYTDLGKKSVKFSNPYDAFSRMLINYFTKYDKRNDKGLKKLFSISKNILNGQKVMQR